MKLTTERLKEIIKEEVTAALMEAPDRKEQLRQAIKMWRTATGLESKNAIALKLAIQRQMRARPHQRHAAMQDVLGQHWASGPDFEADLNDVAYEITGEEKPEQKKQPEPTFSDKQLDRFRQGEISTARKMRSKYT